MTPEVDPPALRFAFDISVGVREADAALAEELQGALERRWSDLDRILGHPQQVEGGAAMPEMGISDEDAKNIAAYLYTLRQ